MFSLDSKGHWARVVSLEADANDNVFCDREDTWCPYYKPSRQYRVGKKYVRRGVADRQILFPTLPSR